MSGEPTGAFAAELEELIVRCEAAIARSEGIRELRGREGRQLGTDTRTRLAELAAALGRLADGCFPSPATGPWTSSPSRT